MIIDQVNLNYLRIFASVYRTRSMTEAAQELHLTQSGVSQHIKSLEDVLGVKLFDRLNQRIVPTQQAGILYERCATSLNELEQVLFQIKETKSQLQGTVALGMPVEFGIQSVLPLLARFAEEHPGIKYKIRLEFTSTLNDLLLKGELDLAFVDSFQMDKRVTQEPVYDEVLELCILPEKFKKTNSAKQNRKYFESLDYVDYQEGEPVLRMWFDHHLGSRNLDLKTKATVFDVQGISRLIISGLGAGILPRSAIQKLEKEGQELHLFKGSGKPLVNKISLAYLDQRTQSPSTLELMKKLKNWLS